MMKVAIVGAGPSAFYAAGALLKEKNAGRRVDMFDRLPTLTVWYAMVSHRIIRRSNLL